MMLPPPCFMCSVFCNTQHYFYRPKYLVCVSSDRTILSHVCCFFYLLYSKPQIKLHLTFFKVSFSTTLSEQTETKYLAKPFGLFL